MTGPLFAQSAWNNVTFTGGEIENPGRNLPLSLFIGCGVVVVLYLLANLAYVVTLPLAAIQGAPQNRVAAATMQAIFGPPGATIMAAAIMISTFGCNNGLILAGARVYYAMARDGLFFNRVGNTQQASRSGGRIDRAGNLGVPADAAAHRDHRSEHRRGHVRQRLHATARIHHLGRLDFLCVDGGRSDFDAKESP